MKICSPWKDRMGEWGLMSERKYMERGQIKTHRIYDDGFPIYVGGTSASLEAQKHYIDKNATMDGWRIIDHAAFEKLSLLV
jgi:hypothetical protein